MRSIKTLGVVTMAATVTMALLGSASATASQSTQLCKVHKEPCQAGNAVTSLHMVNVGALPLLTVKFLGVEIGIVCKQSLAKASVLGLGTAPTPQVVHLEELTWAECEVEGKQKVCVAETTVKGLFDLLKTALNLGTATSLGTSILIVCEGYPTCRYGGEPVLSLEGAGHTAGAGNGMLTANTTVAVEGGGLCPITATFKALYEPLEKVYVVA